MTNKKAILLVAMVLISSTIWAQSEDDFDSEQLPDTTLKITKYKGTVTDVIIPSTLYELKVTVIGKKSFDSSDDYNSPHCIPLTSVVIPDTVTVIEERAFFSGYNDSVGFDEGGYSLGKGKLSTVNIGKGCKTIGKDAFCGNAELIQLTIPDSVIEIGERAFYMCGLTQLHLGNGVRNIGANAFSGDYVMNNIKYTANSLSELILPSSLKTIGNSAFSRNQIQNLIIPNGVVVIGELAFADNPIVSLVVPESLAKLVYTGNFSSRLTGGIFNYSFARCPFIRITLPANTEERMLSNAGFEQSFINFWKSQGQKAGTYVKRGPIWSME
jgi:hypothetical protein